MIFIFLPPNNLEFVEFRIPYENTARNSKIPYRDPRVKLGDDRKRDPPKGLGDDIVGNSRIPQKPQKYS